MLKSPNLLQIGVGAGILLASLIFLSPFGLSAKEKTYGLAGCGLGSIVMGPHGNQVFAGTTNGTSLNQAFGISSDTLNCDAKGGAAYIKKSRENFVAVNYSFLELEMATGKGKRLESFAKLMGCPMEASFVGMAQKNHSLFFGVPKNKPGEFVKRVQREIKNDLVLSQSCSSQA